MWNGYQTIPTTRPETDDELRVRLLYVAGDGPALIQRIRMSSGKQLDDLAAEYNLVRRTVTA